MKVYPLAHQSACLWVIRNHVQHLVRLEEAKVASTITIIQKVLIQITKKARCSIFFGLPVHRVNQPHTVILPHICKGD